MKWEVHILRLIPSFALILVLGTSCSGVAPDKLTFEKEKSADAISYGGHADPLSSSSASIEESSLDSSDVEDLPMTEEGYRLEGVQLYTKLCSSCHLPVESSNRRGVDAGKILNDYTRNFPTHKSIDWPDMDGAFMIEAALAIPVP